MSTHLQNQTRRGLAAVASFGTAATVTTIPVTGKPHGTAKFRHTGTAGFWYGSYNGVTPTTSSYHFKLGPGEPEARDDPPTGSIKLLAGVDANGPCEWATGWYQP